MDEQKEEGMGGKRRVGGKEGKKEDEKEGGVLLVTIFLVLH